MRRGEVYELTVGNARVRALIVSADAFNPGRAEWVLIRPVAEPDRPHPALVPITVPLRGTVDCSWPRPVVRDNLGARVGRVGPSQMQRVDAALRVYLGL